MKKRSSTGFTLIETLVALAIYALLIATLVVVNRTGLDNLNTLEQRALARRALENVITEFRQKNRLGKHPATIGRHTGVYDMSHFHYRWDIYLTQSQDRQSLLLTAEIALEGKKQRLAKQIEVW